MKRDALLSLLETYSPSTGIEEKMHFETTKFVKGNPDCFERTLAEGHVTASGWVVSPERDRVLLMHHRKLDRWFQPGGHCDGEADTAFVAEKEVKEETGLTKVKLACNDIFDVDIHLIPANSKETAHYHYDIRFLFEGDVDEELVINAESKEVKWVPILEVSQMNDSESIMRMVRKTSALRRTM
jgi:8-oxo-dGTP pyrophosphatase MutT (NUDIX family)